MRKEGLDKLTPTGNIESKKSKEKQHVAHLINLCKWMAKHRLGGISAQTLLRAMKNMK